MNYIHWVYVEISFENSKSKNLQRKRSCEFLFVCLNRKKFQFHYFNFNLKYSLFAVKFIIFKSFYLLCFSAESKEIFLLFL